jgi:hypothetical protein
MSDSSYISVNTEIAGKASIVNLGLGEMVGAVGRCKSLHWNLRHLPRFRKLNSILAALGFTKIIASDMN